MNVLITENWNKYLEVFAEDKKDIYYTEEYVKLYETDLDHALCIVCVSDVGVALMPFLRRSIGEYYDFETAYGYSGPIFNTDSVEWIEKALKAIKGYFTEEKYICGFMRFHPLIDNARFCKDEINVIYDRKTIAIILKDSVDDIWMRQISSKNRNMIRKAEKNGLTFHAEYDYSSMDEFVRLYNSTMMRLNAEEFYFFTDVFFDNYKTNMKDKGFLGVVKLKERIIGAALFMVYDKIGHYHLAGSDREYSSLGINNYMLWNAAMEMKKKNVELLHLGGGVSAEVEDSLFKFKRSFSNCEKDYYIGKWLFNKVKYEEIVYEWERDYPELIPVFGKRLLKYRYREEDL